jgi:hypothetical protein
LFLNKCPSDKIIPNIILFKLIGIFIIFLIHVLVVSVAAATHYAAPMYRVHDNNFAATIIINKIHCRT